MITDLPPPSSRSAMAGAAGGLCVAGDEELLPFADGSFDLAVSNLSLHWVNDLPGALLQLRRALKPDGLFIGAMLGGDTLFELRRCLMEAELDLTGGVSARISPFAEVRDAGGLLQRAGFSLPVVDSDTLTVTYDSAFKLMADLRGMGETNAGLNRRRRPTPRALLIDAAKGLALTDKDFTDHAHLQWTSVPTFMDHLISQMDRSQLDLAGGGRHHAL